MATAGSTPLLFCVSGVRPTITVPDTPGESGIQSLPRSEDPRHDRPNGDTEASGDLGIRQLLHVTEPDCVAEGAGQRLESRLQVRIAGFLEQGLFGCFALFREF